MLNQIFLSLGFLVVSYFANTTSIRKKCRVSFCVILLTFCAAFLIENAYLYIAVLRLWNMNISVPPPPQKKRPTITKLGLLCYGGGGDKQNYYRPLPATSGDFVNTIWRKRQQEIHCFYYKLATPTSICTSSCRSLFINSHVE